MDTNPDDLSGLERRLSAWGPTAAGLSAADMLFAAGRAAAQPGRARFVWPALACGMTALAVVLGVWLTAERSERLALARRLAEAPVPGRSTPSIAPPSPSGAGPVEEAPYSFLGARRALESGLEAWQAQEAKEAGPPSQPLPEQPVLQVGQARRPS